MTDRDIAKQLVEDWHALRFSDFKTITDMTYDAIQKGRNLERKKRED